MDNREAVNWLINISADIGKAEHSDLWHYEQALTEIKDMLESAQPVATDTNVGSNSEIPNSSKGHWIFVHPLQEDDTGAYMCSECKVGNWEIDPESYFFCPNCGADMRGGQDERG